MMKKAIHTIFPLVLTLMLGSCTPKMNFQTSSVVPAATGNVSVKKDKNKNYLIQVTVHNLAPADRLTPPQRTYISWMESNGNAIKKLGLLEPKSKDLSASLNATSVAEPTRILITAETNPDSQYPQGTEVLTTTRR